MGYVCFVYTTITSGMKIKIKTILDLQKFYYRHSEMITSFSLYTTISFTSKTNIFLRHFHNYYFRIVQARRANTNALRIL